MQNCYDPALHQAHSKLGPQPLHRVGKPFDQLQSRLNIRQSLRVCAAIQRLFASQTQVLDRLGGVVARTIVVGEIGVVVFQPLMVQRFDRLASTLVQQFAAFGKQRVVGDIVGQRVLEGVFDIARCRLLVDELCVCRLFSSRSSSSSGFLTTPRARASGNSIPITASVCSNSFSAAGSRSIRDARIACTVGGILSDRAAG